LHHGLLTIDILASVERVDGDPRMPVVGRGDDHRVDILPRQDLAIVARGEDALAVEFPGAGEAAVVEVAYRGQFDAGNGSGVASVAAAHAAVADGGDADAVIGGNGFLSGSQSGSESGGCSGLEKMPSRGCHSDKVHLGARFTVTLHGRDFR